MINKTWLVSLLVLAAGSAAAQTSATGLWKTYDANSKAESSLVRISEHEGRLSGRIERLLAADAKADAVCSLCGDERRGQKLQGLEIIRGLKKGDAGQWDGGTILDPSDGKVYKVRLQLTESGRKLDVRGYMGSPMLGRTQTWTRVE